MSVTNGLDFKNCNIGNLLTNMYYYILDKDMIHADNNTNTSVYGYVPNIQSISFQPFADTEDFEIIKSEFNTEKFSDLSGAMPYVYRIKSQINKRKTLKEVELFKTKTRLREESKLQFYPYRYFLICDYINPPLLIKPQLVETSDNKLKLNDETKKIFQENNIEVPSISTSFYQLLKRPGISIQFINKLVDFNYPEAVLEQVEISTKYEGYIVKTNKEIEKMLKLESKQIPKDIDYSKVTNLASEARQKLEKIRPKTIGQATRISGVNPADISILTIYLRKEYPHE